MTQGSTAASTQEAMRATLRTLPQLMEGLNAGLDLDQTMTSVVEGVVGGLGFGVAVVSMVQPSSDLLVTAAAGHPDACQALLGSTSPRSEWDRLLNLAEPVGPGRLLRLVDHRCDAAWNDDVLPFWVPESTTGPAEPSGEVAGERSDGTAGEASAERSGGVAPEPARPAWHPLDALFAPLTSHQAGLLGVLSVDLPVDGLRPTEEQLGLLEVFSAQAATALEHARLHTELVVAHERARTALAARLETLVEASPAAIVELDPMGVVRHWNQSAETLLGYPRAEVVDRPLPTGLVRAFDLGVVFAAVEGGERLPVTELVCRRRDGSAVVVEVSAAPTRTPQGVVQGLMALLVDVTERKRLEEQLHRQATHDPLTGLPNRRMLTDLLQDIQERADTPYTPDTQSAESSTTAVLVVDLDRFTEVNDLLGHEYGDRLLVAVGARIASRIGPEDTVARLSGDEFAVLFSPTGEAQAVERAQDLLAALHQPFDLDGVQVDVEVSIGVTMVRPGEVPEVVMREADRAMRRAKTTSTGVVAFEPRADSPVPQRLVVLGELRRALDHGELVVHYQPQVDVRSGDLVGLEALVRWQHPTRGLLAPAAFLDVAESTGLVLPLTFQVLDRVCVELAGWARDGRRLVPVAVNLSPRCLHDPDLVGRVSRALAEHRVSASLLRLEMTESAVMGNPARALAVVRDLAAVGVQLSLDDFGTGFSSMSHLRDLPATELKVDRSFVTDMTRQHDDFVLVRSTIELAHSLGLFVVAEGIEDEGTLEALRELGCDIAQGYHVARPMPADDLRRWIHDRDRDRSPARPGDVGLAPMPTYP